MVNDTLKDAVSRFQVAGNSKTYTTQFLRHTNDKQRGKGRGDRGMRERERGRRREQERDDELTYNKT